MKSEITEENVSSISEQGETGENHAATSSSHVEQSEALTSEKNRIAWIVTLVAIVALVGIFFLWSRGGNKATPGGGDTEIAIKTEGEHAGDEHGAEGEHAGEAREVKLEPEALASANLEYEGVTQRPAVALLRVSGTIEPNTRNTQQVTPLVGGRVERVNVAVGDRVVAGTVLATIASPQIA